MKILKRFSNILIYSIILFTFVNPVPVVVSLGMNEQGSVQMFLAGKQAYIFSIPVANAAGSSDSYILLEPLPVLNGPGSTGTTDTMDLGTYVIYAVNLLIAISAVAAVFMIIMGGLKYMTTDSWNKKSEGIKMAKDALIGLLMVVSTFIILRTVNKKLVDIPTTLVPPIDNLASSAVSSIYDDMAAGNTQLEKNVAAAKAAIEAQKIALETNNATLQTQKTTLQTEVAALMAPPSSLPNTDPEIASRLAQIQQIDGQMKVNTDKITTQEALALFNTEITAPAGSPRTIQQLIANDQNITAAYSAAFAKLQANGELDLTVLNNNRNYSEAILKLQRLNVSLGSAESYMVVMYGGTGTKTIKMFDPNTGTFANPLRPDEARALIEPFLTSVNNAITSLGTPPATTDPKAATLKSQLQSQYNTTNQAYNRSVIKI